MRALTPIVIVIQAAATIISMAVAAPVDPNGAQSALEKSSVIHMLPPALTSRTASPAWHLRPAIRGTPLRLCGSAAIQAKPGTNFDRH